MIVISKKPGERMLELGGGETPHPSTDVNVDIRQAVDKEGTHKVHFTFNFENFPWPIKDSDFEYIYSQFNIEHISWRKSEQYLREVFRILKPGGQVFIISPNTEAQLQYILSKAEPDGDEGSMLFGDLNYADNSHKSYWSPGIMASYLEKVGFQDIAIQPFGQLETDMATVAKKKAEEKPPDQPPAPVVVKEYDGPNKATLSGEERARLYDRSYFNGRVYKPFYWDAPVYEVVARKILEKKPENVLELGCGRGYVIKRLEDEGVYCTGMDISQHCQLSRVSKNVLLVDTLRDFPWDGEGIDLCYSQGFWEHIPEELLSPLMSRVAKSKRGIHGITLEGEDDGTDPNRCTIKSKKWWEECLPQGHEVVSKSELERGLFPQEVQRGDGKHKINVGCAWTMFHHGWTNIDVVDAIGFAGNYGYKFVRHDVKNGLPMFGTSVVDLIYHAHFLEHLNYSEGLAFLRECRRVIRPDGLMRIVVPNTDRLCSYYYNHDGLDDFNELNEQCQKGAGAQKLWAFLGEGHSSFYDLEVLQYMLKEAGFEGKEVNFRESQSRQMLKETLDVLPSISMFVEAIPMLG